MKFLFGCLLIALLAGVCDDLYAQIIPSAIQGNVLTENHAPVEAATITLLKFRDSSTVSSSIADKNGLFRFTDVKPGGYLLSITKVGYIRSLTSRFTIVAGQTLIMGDIVLIPSANQLSEVSIIGSKPPEDVKAGKVTLNVQNSIIAAGNSAYDILRKSPGVRIDNNDNISLVGRQSALITIDGKPTNLWGEDLAGVLKGMQSNTIDRIELITAGSAKYDASSGGVINIVLKKGENKGANGTFTGSAGYGRYGKGGTGITFNDRTTKLNIFGAYNFLYNKTFHDFITNRNINFNNVLSDYHVDYNSVQKNYSNNFSLGTDYYISPSQTIGFLISGYTRSDNFSKNNTLKISNQGVLDSIITANSDLNRDVTSINYNLNYSGILDKSRKTLAADFDYTTYNRSSSEYITNNFHNPSGNLYKDTLFQRNLSPSNIRIWLSKIDFTDPISKNSRLEAGLKYSNVTSNNDLNFASKLPNGQYQSDPLFTNHFVYTENINSAYVNYAGKFNKVDITGGLRAEQTNAKGHSVTSGSVVNSNYLDIFPQFQLTYHKDDKNDFSLSYNRGIKRPLYTDINPFLYYVDRYDYRIGNPNLKPEYSNSVELSYNYNKRFLFSLYGTVINSAYFANFYEQNDTSKVNITTQKNFGTIYNYGIKVYAPVTVTNWWNATFDLDASYLRYVAYPQNGNLDKGTQAIVFNTTQYFTISKTMVAELSGDYVSPNLDFISQYKANYAVNAGIGKQLFNTRGSIKISATDIFNTERERSVTNYQNLDLTTVIKRESQVVRVTFTYRFGKISIKNTTAHHTGNEDEQKRTGSTGEN